LASQHSAKALGVVLHAYPVIFDGRLAVTGGGFEQEAGQGWPAGRL
jgi:hypothetical protein